MTMFEEYIKWRLDNTIENHRKDYPNFLHRLSEKYFNNTLKIEYGGAGVGWYINDMKDFGPITEDMEYLQRLYDLGSIKHKIERIYGN